MDDPHRPERPTGRSLARARPTLPFPSSWRAHSLGYGISLLMPLHPAPANPARARPAPAAKTGTLEILPANQAENRASSCTGRPSTDLPRHAGQIEPRGAESPETARSTPAVETGSVDAAGASQRSCPARPRHAEASRPETAGAPGVPRRPRRVYYWRPRPKPPAGPVEAFFSALDEIAPRGLTRARPASILPPRPPARSRTSARRAPSGCGRARSRATQGST